jgi:MoaA/NifB/PqqE/SkfB family radical SAM enzyme
MQNYLFRRDTMPSIEEVKHAAERQAVGVMIDGLIKNLKNSDDRTKTYLKIVGLAQKYFGKAFTPEKVEKVKKDVSDPDNRWMKFINRTIDEINPNFAKMTLLNLGYEAFLRGTKMIRENREKYNCNIPWLILFDPTSACNMHCVGCWSGTYGHKNNLSFEDMDKIVTEGKKLGVYLYLMTGGEPMVRKKDLLRLIEKHHDCYFAAFSNSTLIDEDFCKELVRLGNMTFLLSIEGTPDTNDARRGTGHYAEVMRAMDLLKKYGILFGTSVCYTSQNVEAVTSDDFFHLLEEKGAKFGFYFHYMPIGKNAVPALMPTPEQRKYMIDRIRYIRSDKSDIQFYPMDFQNDGEYVGGCIAGGRNYFHINSSGDAEPCVFIHFSNANIHDQSVLEILKSPLFMMYHEGQPFNRNHLRPCPMLENPELLRKMVKETGAHQTNEEAPESVEELCAKCDDYAAKWKPMAEKIWSEETHKEATYENYTKLHRDHPELAAFEQPDEKAVN